MSTDNEASKGCDGVHDLAAINEHLLNLLPAVLDREPDAENQFFNLVFPRLERWASARFSIKRDDTEDFAMEVLEKALVRLPNFKSEGSKLTTWLFVIARNHAIDKNRKRERDPLATSNDILEWLEAPPLADEGYGELEEPTALGPSFGLSDREIHFLELTCTTTLSSGEIAKLLRIKPCCVRQRKKRLLEQVRRTSSESMSQEGVTKEEDRFS